MVERFTAPPNYDLSYSDPKINSTSSTKKAFTAAGSNNFRAFDVLGLFRTKDYSTSQFNTSNYWAGNFKFKTSDANLNSGSTLSSIIRVFKTKTAGTKTASESGDTFQTREDLLTSERSNNVFRGKLQKRLDKEGEKVLQGENPIQGGGAMHVMTIEEVRDLLNKAK